MKAGHAAWVAASSGEDSKLLPTLAQARGPRWLRMRTPKKGSVASDGFGGETSSAFFSLVLLATDCVLLFPFTFLPSAEPKQIESLKVKDEEPAPEGEEEAAA